jgi:dTDP-4-dehydrorhamnose reductase
LAEWILSRLNAGQTVPGFVDAVFSPLHTTFLAEIFMAMLDAGCGGLYHVGSHDAVTKFDFAKRLAERIGRDPDQVKPAHMAAAHFKALRPRNLSLNVTKIESTLGRNMPLVEDVIQCFQGSSPA